MRIAFVVPGFSAHPADWAIPALQHLAQALAAEHDLHVFSQRYPAAGTYRFDNLTHYAMGGGQRFGLASAKIWWQTSRAILAQHRRTPFDLIHAFWADEAGFSAAIAGLKVGRPVIVSLGGGELIRLASIPYGAQRFLARRLTTGFALRRATRVTAGSAYQLELGRNHGVPAAKLALAPLGVDTDHFCPPPLPASIEPPTLIQVASLVPVKNQALLLRTVSQVKARLPAVRLKIAGSGPLQGELRKLADQLELSHNIDWLGQVSHPDTRRMYQQAHLYLQTSWHESQGMAVLEGLACGLPVLGTPVGLGRELAALPPAVTSSDLADQVVELMRDPRRYRRLRRQARRLAEGEFSLPVTAGNFSRLYEVVTNKFTVTP
jgi:glycosyltransferase involved in cell wall biosynthesis